MQYFVLFHGNLRQSAHFPDNRQSSGAKMRVARACCDVLERWAPTNADEIDPIERAYRAQSAIVQFVVSIM